MTSARRVACSLLLLGALGAGVPAAGGRTGLDRRLAGLASRQVGRDVRIRFAFQRNARLCGGEGDAYVGHLQVNRFRRGYDASGRPTVLDSWVDLDKTYYIFVDDLRGPDPKLSDADQCME